MATNDSLKVQGQVITAARFVLDMGPMGIMAFSELGGINSKVAPSEYIFSDATGNTVHTKQFGKTEPPTITLKRALDKEGNAMIFGWHEMARQGLAGARQDGTMTIGDAENNQERLVRYKLHQAWIQEISVAGLKAGDTSAATIEIKMACDAIVPVDMKMFPGVKPMTS